jgi:S-formylglutathione hydrolase FrmB
MRFTILFLLFSQLAFSQISSIQTEMHKSEVLKREMRYSVYLPPSYNTSNRSYPVVYLLHGMTGDYTDWVNKGEADFITTKAIENGKTPELIIIMPDGLYDAFYQNNFDKSIMWEDYFIKELMPIVEKKYRILGNRANRAIAGLSMGGYGSMYQALKHRDLFSYCYAMSAAFLEIEPIKSGETPTAWFEDLYIKLWGKRNESGLHQNYLSNSILEMVKAMPEYKAPQGWPPSPGADLGLPKIFIDCGDDDFLLKMNTNLVHALKDKKIPFEFRVRDGGHDWSYWRSALEIALEVIGKSFRD